MSYRRSGYRSGKTYPRFFGGKSRYGSGKTYSKPLWKMSNEEIINMAYKALQRVESTLCYVDKSIMSEQDQMNYEEIMGMIRNARDLLLRLLPKPKPANEGERK